MEGSFSTIKNWGNHEIIPLVEIINLFLLHSEMLMKKSLKMKKLVIDPSLYKGAELGNLCISKLMNEYEIFKSKLKNISDYNSPLVVIDGYRKIINCNCDITHEYGLPCCHMMFNRYNEFRIPLLCESDIPDIYFATKINDDKNTTTDIVRKKDEVKNNNYSYSNLMDKVSQIASEASRNKDVQKLFDNFFDEFDNLKIDIKGSPSCLSQQGRPITRQSLFVEHNHKSGAPKKKAIYHCKHCGMPGHNISTCPNKKKE